MNPILHIAAYESVALHDLKQRQARLTALCDRWNLKGSILLSPTAIRLSVAGETEAVEWLLSELRSWPGLEELAVRTSGNARSPFRHMRVRVTHRNSTAPETDLHLQRTASEQCQRCKLPLSEGDRQHAHFIAGSSCPYCYRAPPEQMAVTLDRRHEQIERLITPLPGSVPRDQFRALHVPAGCDGGRLLEVLCQLVSHAPMPFWLDRFAQGLILDESGEPASPERIVHAGERFRHRFADVTEPDVDMRIRLLYEDEVLLVLNKPAPLPMHAGGRFHRNTLKYVLDALYHPQKPRPSHRLDANTTGAAVVARTQYVARKLQMQFARGEVEKLYLVRVHGHPEADEFVCDAPISADAGEAGSRYIDSENGLPSRTEFHVRERMSDGTALLEARPLTGRTNQIRVHLWHLGFPICGDPVYLRDGGIGDSQTLPVDASPLCLHAWRIAFVHPLHRERMSFTAPAPSWAG